jgi:glutathione S-transferase
MAAPIYKLIYNPNSPYVHKVLVAAREIGVRDKIGLEQVTVVPFDAVPNAIATKGNPLAKVSSI